MNAPLADHGLAAFARYCSKPSKPQSRIPRRIRMKETAHHRQLVCSLLIGITLVSVVSGACCPVPQGTPPNAFPANGSDLLMAASAYTNGLWNTGATAPYGAMYDFYDGG
jgi:hypothetical protein